MADIGVQPTKDTVRITSSTGEHATITAANGSQAGIMSARQARQLEDLASRLESGTISTVEILRPAPRPITPQITLPPDLVTRSELRDALEQWRGTVLQDVTAILNTIRQEVPVETQVSSIDSGRLHQIELAISNLDQRLQTIEQQHAGFARTMAEINAAFSDVLKERAA